MANSCLTLVLNFQVYHITACIGFCHLDMTAPLGQVTDSWELRDDLINPRRLKPCGYRSGFPPSRE